MSRRTDRIARLIQVHLAELINYRLNDPRVEAMVTVSTVDVSPDLSHARVRVTAMNAADAKMRTIARALNHAAGKLRSMLGERIEMRNVPSLDFFVDEHAIRARRTLEAIARAMRDTRPLPEGTGRVGEGESGRVGDEEDAETRGRPDAENEEEAKATDV
jgi:ribosome-binding factor A